MRAHYLQHVPFEKPGSIEPWLKSRGYAVTCTRLFKNESFPDIKDIDMLIILGGPMSVNDENEFPWLAPEKKYIREFIQYGRPVLGICLGAQLIAGAMGCRVYRNSEKEIGWLPVRGTKQDADHVFRFPELFTVFQWHGETFDLPAGAALLASSEGCVNQAFQLGRDVIGLQFHLETTRESARKMTENCGNELQPAKYIQSEQEILAASSETYRILNSLMSDVLSFLAGTSVTGI